MGLLREVCCRCLLFSALTVTANHCIAQDSANLIQNASALRQSGRVSQSITQLQSALLLAKDDSQRMQAAGELGAAYTQARQFDRAQKSLTQALALAQGEQRAHYELGLGNLASLQKDTAAALGHYQRAVETLGRGLEIARARQDAVIESYHRALAMGVQVVKPPRTTWNGTPLHELWLRDPTGYNVEVYARLRPEELARMPADKRPTFLVPGTEPAS